MFIPGLREWLSNTFSFHSPENRLFRIFVLSWVTAAALLLKVSLGEAARGEICYSASTPLLQATPLMNTTAFTCPTLGVVTIPQIYQLGWRVSQAAPVVVLNDPTNPSNSQGAWMILIEGP